MWVNRWCEHAREWVRTRGHRGGGGDCEFVSVQHDRDWGGLTPGPRSDLHPTGLGPISLKLYWCLATWGWVRQVLQVLQVGRQVFNVACRFWDGHVRHVRAAAAVPAPDLPLRLG